MKSPRCLALSLVFCSSIGACRSVLAQDTTLRYHWTVGEELRYRETEESTITTVNADDPLGGDSAVQEVTYTKVTRTIVDSVATDGTATLRQVTAALRQVLTDNGRIVFDSESVGPVPSNPLQRQFAEYSSAVLSEPLTLVVTPDGTVRKVEGMSRIRDRILAGADPRSPALAEDLKESFSDDATRYLARRGTAVLPGRPLKPGDSWSDQLLMAVSNIGGLSSPRTWVLREVGRGDGTTIARLTSKSTITANPEQDTRVPLMRTTKAVEGTIDGEMLFDITRGRLQRATTETTQTVTMSSAFTTGGPTAHLRIVTKSRLVIELIDADSR